MNGGGSANPCRSPLAEKKRTRGLHSPAAAGARAPVHDRWTPPSARQNGRSAWKLNSRVFGFYSLRTSRVERLTIQQVRRTCPARAKQIWRPGFNRGTSYVSRAETRSAPLRLLSLNKEPPGQQATRVYDGCADAIVSGSRYLEPRDGASDCLICMCIAGWGLVIAWVGHVSCGTNCERRTRRCSVRPPRTRASFGTLLGARDVDRESTLIAQVAPECRTGT